MTSLKVYHWQSFRTECPPKPNGSRQTTELMAARSGAELMRATGMSRHHFNTWVYEGSGDDDERLALGSPGVLFWQPIDSRGDDRNIWARDGEEWPPEPNKAAPTAGKSNEGESDDEESA